MHPTGVPSTAEQRVSIPDKLYFRIGEVAQLAGVEPYVLRYWETEFPKLMPKKSGSGHRLYRRKDVEMVLELKRLLYEKRFTLEGARLYIEQSKKAAKKAEPSPIAKPTQTSLFGPPPGSIDPQKLDPLKSELRSLITMLTARPR